MSGAGLATIDRGVGPRWCCCTVNPARARSWDPVTDLLADRFRVLAPDRPGYGRTSGEATGIAGNAEAVADLVEATGSGPSPWSPTAGRAEWPCCWPTGGPTWCTAWCWSGCLHPRQHRRHRPAVGPALVGEVLTVAGLVALGEVLPRVRGLAPRLPERFRDRSGPPLPDPGVLGGERGALGRHRRTFVTEQRALLEELPDVVDALGRIRVPTAVVVGRWDVVVRPSAGRTLAASVEGAELVELPRAGHFVARDAPDALASWSSRYAPGERVSR